MAGEQVHLDLRHHVAADRHAMRLRERGDLAPRRDAAHAREVEDDHIHRARFEQRAERVEVIEVLTARDRHFESRRSSASPARSR